MEMKTKVNKMQTYIFSTLMRFSKGFFVLKRALLNSYTRIKLKKMYL